MLVKAERRREKWRDTARKGTGELIKPSNSHN